MTVFMNNTVQEHAVSYQFDSGPKVLNCNYINAIPMAFYGIDTKVQTENLSENIDIRKSAL